MNNRKQTEKRVKENSGTCETNTRSNIPNIEVLEGKNMD